MIISTIQTDTSEKPVSGIQEMLFLHSAWAQYWNKACIQKLFLYKL
jgi:hypothetical protein